MTRNMSRVRCPVSCAVAARIRDLLIGVLASASIALPVVAQTPADATHDHTTTAGSPTTLIEAWADIKSPGVMLPPQLGTTSVGLSKVAVGTIAIDTAMQGVSSFSFQPVSLPPLPMIPWVVTVGGPRQVVILQATDDVGQILFQNYFYGVTPDRDRNGRRPRQQRPRHLDLA